MKSRVLLDFLLDENIGSAEFVTDMEQVSMNHVADHAIDIQVGDEVYSVVLSVVDTEASCHKCKRYRRICHN